MKHFLKGIGSLLIAMTMSVNCFAAQQPQVYVNSSQISMQDPLVTENGKVYISLRDIGNAFDCEFSWSEDKKTVNLKNENVIIALQSDNRWCVRKRRDGKVENYKFNEADIPRTIDGKIYVPVGGFTILSGGQVGWDDKSNLFNIIYNSQLDYERAGSARLYAGTGKRGSDDGEKAKSTFYYPNSVYVTDSGEVYIADAGHLRMIAKESTKTLKVTPDNVKLALLRGKKNDVYAMSTAYPMTNMGEVVSLFKVEGNTLKTIRTERLDKNNFVDFSVLSDHEICLLRDDLQVNKRYLEIMDVKTNEVTVRVEVSKDFNCLAAGETAIYVGNGQNGTIYSYDLTKKTFALFAGQEDKHQFVDGAKPLFSKPRVLKYYNGSLYVLDYNLIRKITMTQKGELINCQTSVGKASALINPKMMPDAAGEMLISITSPVDFVVSGMGLFVTDANQFKVMVVK